MKLFQTILILFFPLLFFSCDGQTPFGDKYLKLEKTISLPTVKGRIDHLDVDEKNKILFVAALGNNTVEVIDLTTGTVIHSIIGLHEPQGLGYVPQTNELLVANGGNGDCYFFNASNFQKTATIHLDGDADDVRYDSIDHRLYVGYGDGGIAEIDAMTHQLVAKILLPAHPEGFQLDRVLNRIIVNVPEKNAIALLDITQSKLVDMWRRNSPTANFPMGIDVNSHRVFVGYRHPAMLAIFSIGSGEELGTMKMVSDADDVYFDQDKIYVSGGGGFINIFEWKAAKLSQVANIPTTDGARTSLLARRLHLFILAARSHGANSAQIRVYQTRP